MQNDDSLFRALIGRSAPAPTTSENNRYAKGMFSSYLHRAEDAAVSARAYAHAQRGSREATWREIARAAENLVKAIRVAHGLTATRSRDLGVLLHGGDGVRSLPPSGEWLARLAWLEHCESGTRGEEADPLAVIVRVEQLVTEARSINPPSKRVSARPRASPRSTRVA